MAEPLELRPPLPRVVVGIDLSLTATGLCRLRDGALEKYDLVQTKPTGWIVPVERLRYIAEAVLLFCHAEGSPADLVGIEGYSFGAKGDALFQLGELGGIVRYLLLKNRVPFMVVPPGHWRKQLLGKGNLAKDQVRVEMWKRYGIENDSLDVLEAHAVALATFRQAHGLDAPAPKTRRAPHRVAL